MLDLFVKIKGILVLIIVTGYLNPNDFGVWSQSAMVGAFIAPFILLGSESGIMRILPGLSKEEKFSSMLGWAILLLVSYVFIIFLQNCFGLNNFSNIFFGNENYIKFILVADLMMLTGIFINFIKIWYRVNDDTYTYGAFVMLQSVISMMAIFGGIYFRQNVTTLLLLIVISDLIVILLYLIKIFKENRFSSLSFNILLAVYKYGAPLLPVSFFMWGLNYSDRFFLVKNSSLIEVGIYSLAYQVGYYAVQMVSSQFWIMFPSKTSAYHNSNQQHLIQNLFNQSLGGTLLLGLPCAIILSIFGGNILELLSSKQYSQGATVIPIIFIAYLIHMIASYYENSLGLVNKQWLSTSAIFIAFSANVICNILLIPSYSIIGAAFATLIGFSAQLAFCYYFSRKYTLIKTKFNFLLKILTINIAIGSCLLLTSFILSSNYYSIAIQIIFYLIIYLIILKILNIINIKIPKFQEIINK